MFNNLYRPVSSGVTALAIALLLCAAISHGTAQTALADTPVTCSISPSTLPAGTVGTAYSTMFEASGGTEPYAWTVIGGALPAGLTLGSITGVISGTPSTAGTYSFIVRVDDNAQHYGTMSISISVSSSSTASDVETISTLLLSNADSFVLSDNVLSSAKELSSSDGRVRLSLAANTAINMQGLTQLGAATESNPPAAADNSTLIRAYSFIPSGATFSPATTMTLKYEKASLPAGAEESNLYIAFWNGTAWEKITSTVDTGTQEVSARVGHFTVFTIRYLPPAMVTTTTTTTATTITTAITPVTVSYNILGTTSSFSTSGDKLLSAVSLNSSTGKMIISIADNTTVSLPARSQQITVMQLATMPTPPAGSKVIEAYAFGPDNATFSPAITVTVKYDAAGLPSDVQESNLYLALLENSNWTALASTVDTQAKTVTAQVSHFSIYALLGRAEAAPVAPAAPAAPEAPTPDTTPSGPPTAAGNEAPSGMSIPILAIIIAGGLLVIVLVIILVVRQRSSY